MKYMYVCMHVRTCLYVITKQSNNTYKTVCVQKTCPKSRVASQHVGIHCVRSRTTVEDHGSTGQGKHALLCEQLPSVIVDPCLYYCCIAHQALAALHSLCTEGCVRTV